MSEPTLFAKKFDRYGFTEEEWEALTPLERVIHYNKHFPKGCTHKLNINDWNIDLRDSYSFDPYFHTAHIEPCQRHRLSIKECYCQMCRGRIGIPQ